MNLKFDIQSDYLELGTITQNYVGATELMNIYFLACLYSATPFYSGEAILFTGKK